MDSSNQKLYDTIIVGGSYAGLSAAMTLGRSLRNVLIIDSGNPCNRQTPNSHNFLTRDGVPPEEIAKIARDEVSKYPTIELYKGFAVNGCKISEGFMIKTSDSNLFKGKKLIFATGILDSLHDIKGFAECWGISVIHCPYCHGYEVRNKKTAILADGDRLVYFTSLIKNLTDDLTLIISEINASNADNIAILKRNGVKIIEKKISEIQHHNGYIDKVIFSDVTSESFEAMYAPVSFQQHSGIPEELGCEMTDVGLIKIDEAHKTTVDSVYAVGDNSNLLRSVSLAVSSGSVAGVKINGELSADMFSE
ncbi:NAD(P)/FAD-dependent oxidoreductase [Chryseobacterium sp. LC2016-27]|uniref:NAD(P)/FAD-dependent oxidoreductase n=1 Tax=Chryseobacterium sp. LC2016-27 TaxID=2897326 RepID=UPI001E39BFA4|nr:NAD(P)/FAD-dependent oxidoreductase [Chryseobacterium sp. LC2016-27]MCD0456387.1 NAD(P)/FAD-dependent oxidoreductase [Chryseobacterium sp. LC2016-27]